MSSPPPFLIDSHVHLWEADAVDKLAWCKPENVLARRCALPDYLESVKSKAVEAAGDDKEGDDQPSPRVGYIFVECDRKTGEDGSDWEQPLAEVAYLRSIIEEEEKNESASQARCLALVPWAPVHSGPEALQRYLDAAREAAGPVAWPRVRGFRYLVQDKPQGTMLRDEFVASLKLLGRLGFVFELGVDQHRRGRPQMDETVALLERVHSEDVPDAEKVVLVINHLGKPDLTVLNPAADRGFDAWRSTMFALGKASSKHVYVKVSGLFSEMPAALHGQSSDAIFVATFAWFAVLLAALGPSRLMFGSDWPVCTTSFAPADVEKPSERTMTAAETGSWDKWRRVVARMCYMATLSEEDQASIWAGTAVKAYGLDIQK